MTIERFPEAAEPETAEREAAEPEGTDPEAGEIALLQADDEDADALGQGDDVSADLERLSNPPAVPLPAPRPDTVARYAPPPGDAAGIPQPTRKPTPPA